MKIEELPDWRVAKAAKVAEDTLLPSGKPAKKGDLVLVVTFTEDSREGIVHFPTPGAPMLATNVAVRASHGAADLRRKVNWTTIPGVPEKHLPNVDAHLLFDYFEQAMIAATFSFQALEAFANQLIANAVEGTYVLRRKDGDREVSGDELERVASTEEKFSTILPDLTGKSSPKGKAVWASFKKLKAARDSITHLKSYDHYVRGGVDTESLYYRLLNSEAREYPRTALALMRHFSGGFGLIWIQHAEALLSAKD